MASGGVSGPWYHRILCSINPAFGMRLYGNTVFDQVQRIDDDDDGGDNSDGCSGGGACELG